MRIVFFGSDDFAVVHLKKLIASSNEVVAVVTQPDKAKGRGMKIGISPVKECAGKEGLPVLQPTDLSDESFFDQLKGFESDLFIVIAYGKFLPKEVLAIPRICSINVHGSLLPKYRGAAPINWAIINGDKETGVSVIAMNEKMDAGDVISQVKMTIEPNETAIALRARMAEVGAELLINTLPDIEKQKYSSIAQKKEEVSYASKLKKELGAIDWNKSAVEIHNLVRGLLPWPSAYTSYDGKMLKIIEAVFCDVSGKPGEILEVSKEGILVGCAKGSLLIKKLHPESSKVMDAASFAAGHKIVVGQMM